MHAQCIGKSLALKVARHTHSLAELLRGKQALLIGLAKSIPVLAQMALLSSIRTSEKLVTLETKPSVHFKLTSKINLTTITHWTVLMPLFVQLKLVQMELERES